MMRLLWADECDAAAGAPPDASLWGIWESDQWQPAAELQTYTADAADAHYDGDGRLVIVARRRGGTGRPYTSARLSARRGPGRPMFHYGLFEAAIRVPTGMGAWPAWWLLGEDDVFGWPECGEVDIMEAPSSATTAGQVHQGTHSPSRCGEGDVGAGVAPSSGEWGSAFHVYAALWSPGRIEFFLDGRSTGPVTRADVEAAGGLWRFDERHLSPVLNLAVGGWAGPPGDWSEQTMQIAWVRVWG